LVRSADLDALIPVDAEPLQRFKELVVAFLAVARGVGVLDAENELAVSVASIGPIEEGRSDQADMRGTCGRRAETNPDGGFRRDGGDRSAWGVVRRGGSSHSGSNFTVCHWPA